MNGDLCIVATDALSLNVLYRGQLEYLRDSGVVVSLVCGGRPSEVACLRARGVGEVVHVPLVRKPKPLGDLIALVQLTFLFCRKRYRTVVLTTPKAILLGALSAWLGRQPRRVVFFRGRVYENYRGIKRKIFVLIDWLSAACAHEILFVSNSLMDAYCQDSKIYRRKGRVLGSGSGNGVSLSDFDPARYSADEVRGLRDALGLSDENFVAISIGRICFDKGLAELLALARRAACDDPSVRFLVVGDVEEGSEVAFGELLSIGNVLHVRFASEVSCYFRLADVHLFLTHREGFGNVAIEAAAMGVPTIAFDVVGVRDSVAEGISGRRVPLGNVDAVWAELQRGRSEPDRAVTAGEVRRWVVENFEQTRVWGAYAAFYRG